MRVEWRWDRYSFAVTDFYGYSGLPYADPVFSYSRNVDPVSGRPRRLESEARCRTAGKTTVCPVTTPSSSTASTSSSST